MRKVSAFSARLSYSNNEHARRDTFSRDNQTRVVPNGTIEVFMTPNLIKMSIKEMKRPVFSRFMTLVKSAKAFVKSNKKPEDLMYLKKFLVIQLTELLGAYVDMLATNNSLQLTNYLKINSICRGAADEAKKLSRIMIQCNRIRKATGVLPPKNQRDLNIALENFTAAVIDDITQKSPINVNNPLQNPSLTEYNNEN